MLSLGLGTTAQAFHDGGVAHCDGCHTMHNSEDGETISDNIGASLTRGTDPSSTCLNCHGPSTTGRYHIFSTDGSNLTPGGDFYWLTKTFTYTTFRPQTRNGWTFGHNVIAADYSLEPDPVLDVAPGGSFQSAWLACSSCHDPHGKKANKSLPIGASGSYGEEPPAGTESGNYRLLGDIGYSPGPGGANTFTNGPPNAETPNQNFGDPFDKESNDNHTDYGQGMSEWCANCHTGFDEGLGSAGSPKHPANNDATLGAGGIATNYNIYVATGDLTGTADAAYLALVPFERGTDDPTALDPFSTQGPDASSNVMCLTCHRAHASAFPNAGRWDFETELLVDSHPQTGDGGASATDQLRSYYNRDIETVFGVGQRSLCNKCHIQD